MYYVNLHNNDLATVSNKVPFSLAIDSSTGEYGYKKVGADTVTPFKNGIDLNDTNSGFLYLLSLMKMGEIMIKAKASRGRTIVNPFLLCTTNREAEQSPAMYMKYIDTNNLSFAGTFGCSPIMIGVIYKTGGNIYVYNTSYDSYDPSNDIYLKNFDVELSSNSTKIVEYYTNSSASFANTNPFSVYLSIQSVTYKGVTYTR